MAMLKYQLEQEYSSRTEDSRLAKLLSNVVGLAGGDFGGIRNRRITISERAGAEELDLNTEL